MMLPRTLDARVAFAPAALLAALVIACPAGAQDFSTIIETRDFPLDNRSRTVILQEDLTPRAYTIVMARNTRVEDNHAEIVARRSASSFEERFQESVARQDQIYDLYRRLSR